MITSVAFVGMKIGGEGEFSTTGDSRRFILKLITGKSIEMQLSRFVRNKYDKTNADFVEVVTFKNDDDF